LLVVLGRMRNRLHPNPNHCVKVRPVWNGIGEVKLLTKNLQESKNYGVLSSGAIVALTLMYHLKLLQLLATPYADRRTP